VSSWNDPILSICIPTFNRAPSLSNLLRSLGAVKEYFGDQIEICISNNGSRDDTAAVIAKFEAALGLVVKHQARNIGGTLNMISVVQNMRGRWGILVGDDDELSVEGLNALVSHLRTLHDDPWVLVEAANLQGQQLYLRDFSEGLWPAAAFARCLLRTGLNPFGFMGVHVFPQPSTTTFAQLDLLDSQPWPHIAVMLREVLVAHRPVSVLRRTVTLQARGGAKLFWAGGDLARIRLGKIRILSRAAWNLRSGRKYLHLLMIREVLALASFKSLMAWKLYEPADYDRNAVKTYLESYRWLGAAAPLVLPHALLMFLLRLLPSSVYIKIFRLVGQGRLQSNYLELKRELGVHDGVKRGI
jgi:glycosyltransferase involved in cell wall biosynthesis